MVGEGCCLFGYCQKQNYLAGRELFGTYAQCSNSYESNLPVLEQHAHAVLKYLDRTWQYPIMRQRKIASRLYFCDLLTKMIQTHDNKLKSKTGIEKHFGERMCHRYREKTSWSSLILYGMLYWHHCIWLMLHLINISTQPSYPAIPHVTC